LTVTRTAFIKIEHPAFWIGDASVTGRLYAHKTNEK